jgi:Na+-transporting NADH:ubiquinone oxidoreductase subunit NqrC
VKVRIVALVCSVLLVACAVRTPIEQAELPKNAEILKNTGIVLHDFSVKPGLLNGTTTINQVKYSTKDYLIAKNLFESVQNKSEENAELPHLVVDVQLVDLRIVSTGIRILAGPFAGRSHIKIMASIFDQNGTRIAQKELIGAPSAFTSSFS